MRRAAALLASFGAFALYGSFVAHPERSDLRCEAAVVNDGSFLSWETAGKVCPPRSSATFGVYKFRFQVADTG